MRCAVAGLAASTVPDPDGRLRDLLEVAITTGRRLQPQPVELGDAPLPVWVKD
jgi:hypothetical protein